MSPSPETEAAFVVVAEWLEVEVEVAVMEFLAASSSEEEGVVRALSSEDKSDDGGATAGVCPAFETLGCS